jgi:hypothetical protein
MNLRIFGKITLGIGSKRLDSLKSIFKEGKFPVKDEISGEC